MSPELKTVLEFCLEKGLEVPPARRSLLYRGCAEICASKQLEANFRATADALDNAELLSRQLLFDFQNATLKRNRLSGDTLNSK